MKKLLLLSSTFPDQDSVSTIAHNLHQAYLNLESFIIETCYVEKKRLSSQAHKSFDFVIIIHPMVIINPELTFILKEISPKAKIFIHVFGDFVRKSFFYLALGKILQKKHVTFLAAGNAYDELTRKTLINPSTEIFPFPVNQKKFSFSPSLRKTFRKKFQFSEEAQIIVYSGRVSPQKNIHALLEVFYGLRKQKKNLELVIVGNVDDFENPTFYERKYSPGEYFFELSTFIKQNNMKNVTFIPRVGHKELNGIYNAADLFVSLSLYHDEDYGYAPIEALLTGCPVVLTSWGGYRDLPNTPYTSKLVKLIPVNYSHGELSISMSHAEAELNKSLTSCLLLDRKKCAESLQSHYSVKNTKKKLMNVLRSPANAFEGFTEEFAQLSLTMMTRSKVDRETYKYFYSSFWESKI